MTIQELGTIMQFKPDVKIIILNNKFLGMVRQWQELFHKNRYSFVDIESPDFVMVAKGYGIEGKSVCKREDVKSALKEMLDHKGSYSGSNGGQRKQCVSHGSAGSWGSSSFEEEEI
jgi:acetolactate synthase-1/2/3 large subunit